MVLARMIVVLRWVGPPGIASPGSACRFFLRHCSVFLVEFYFRVLGDEFGLEKSASKITQRNVDCDAPGVRLQEPLLLQRSGAVS